MHEALHENATIMLEVNIMHEALRYVTKSIIVAFECTTLKDAGLDKCVLKNLVQVTWLSTNRPQSLTGS